MVSDPAAGVGAYPHPEPSHGAPFRTPINFFVLGVLFFALGLAAAPFAIGQAIEFFYQPWLLALVHSFTLGWVTATIMGVMYRYGPALTHSRIRFPRLAAAQFVLYLVGVLGMVSHFATGAWVGLWWSAILVVASVILFAINLIPSLAPQFGRGVGESGMLLAILFLLAAAGWGMMLGIDKSYNFMGGDLLTNIAGHVALAGGGWVAIAICAVAYRMVPAFTVTSVKLPRAAGFQIAGLAIGVAGLFTVLIARIAGAPAFAALVAAALLAWVAIMLRAVAAHRAPIDWTARHALAGVGWLIITCGFGLTLAWAGSDTVIGNRAAGGFAVAGLLGWAGNFIVGMSYKLFPGMVTRVRADAGWAAVPGAELQLAAPHAWILAVFNLGVATAAAGLAGGSAMLARAGAAACAAAAIPYAIAALRTLMRAYRAGE